MRCNVFTLTQRAVRVLAVGAGMVAALTCTVEPSVAAPAQQDPLRVTIGTESFESSPRDELRVSPTRLVIDQARPGTASTQYIYVRNRRSRTTSFTLEVVALAGSPDPLRRVTFLDADDPAAQATAQSWLRPLASRIVLRPRQYAVVPVEVRVPPSAQAGGHYAAVVVRMEQATITSGENGGRLGVSAEAAVPVLATVPGTARASALIVSLSASSLARSQQAWPVRVLVENTGRVHVAPRGTVRITSLFGQEVARIRVQPRTLLPGARDRVTVTWKRTPWIGRYNVQTRLTWDGASGAATRTITLWVLPPWWVWMVAVVVLGGATLGLTRRRRNSSWPEDHDEDAADTDDDWLAANPVDATDR